MSNVVPIAVLVSAALSLPIAFARGGPLSRPAERSVAVQLLAINDFHGNLEPPSGADGEINATAAGGAEYLATHLANAIARNPNSIVVAAGDVIGASPFVSSLFHDEPTIEAMNAMHLAVSSVGNHEFDEGPAELLRMKRGGCHPIAGCQDGDGFTGATFQYLSANVIRTSTRAPLFPATAIRTVGGVKLGFIGETLTGTPRIVASAGTRGLTFLDEAATANTQAARLKRHGVHAIVLLIHQGGRQRPVDGGPDPNGCVNFGGAIDPILDKLSPDIQVVIAGHSHVFYNCRIGNRLVTSAGSYGRMFTRVTLDIDRATDRIAAASAVNEIVTRDVARDPAQTRIIEKYATRAAGSANTVVGAVTADLKRAANAAGESAVGDVVADALLAATTTKQTGGATLAFINTGGIRADIVGSVRPANQAGDVTYRDLFSVQPFGNTVTVVTMTGDLIKRLLEQQFDNPRPGASAILQVSSGFTYRYRANAPAGQHVEADSIMIDGRHIAATDRLRVVTVDYLVDGGNGYAAFGEGTDKLVGVADIDALVAFFKGHSPIAPPPQNRIVRIE
jgi:5'-nucleotidase